MDLTAENVALVFGVLFGISEALSLVPWIRSNGVFQIIYNALKRLAGK